MCHFNYKTQPPIILLTHFYDSLQELLNAELLEEKNGQMSAYQTDLLSDQRH